MIELQKGKGNPFFSLMEMGIWVLERPMLQKWWVLHMKGTSKCYAMKEVVSRPVHQVGSEKLHMTEPCNIELEENLI